MKRSFALLTAIVIFAFCLIGCSGRSNSDAGGVHDVTPDTKPTVIPEDNLPGNDANEGGGAGGTNHSDDPEMNRDDGILNDVGDAAGDFMRGVGNGVGDVLNDVGNAVKNGDRTIERAVGK